MSMQTTKVNTAEGATPMTGAIKRAQEAKYLSASAPKPVDGMSGSNGVGSNTDAPLYNGFEWQGLPKQQEAPNNARILPDYNNVVLASESLEMVEVEPSPLKNARTASIYEANANLLRPKDEK